MLNNKTGQQKYHYPDNIFPREQSPYFFQILKPPICPHQEPPSGTTLFNLYPYLLPICLSFAIHPLFINPNELLPNYLYNLIKSNIKPP